MRRLAVCAVVGLLAFAQGAAANAPKSLADSGDWQAYSYAEKSGRVCYAATRAVKTSGGAKDRVGTALIVTHRTDAKGEVSLVGDFGFKKGADVSVTLDGKAHAFFSRGNSAWVRDENMDPVIVLAMRRGDALTVKGTAEKGGAFTDTISLKGFSAALAAIDKACGVKR